MYTKLVKLLAFLLYKEGWIHLVSSSFIAKLSWFDYIPILSSTLSSSSWSHVYKSAMHTYGIMAKVKKNTTTFFFSIFWYQHFLAFPHLAFLVIGIFRVAFLQLT